MAPAIWRRFFKPYLAKRIKLAKSLRPDLLVSYHSDGDVTDVLDDFVEIGIDILNPVQPECMDIPAFAKRYSGNLTVYGGLGTQSTLAFGSPSDVEKEVKALVELGRAGMGLIIAPSHFIEPEVPIDNILALHNTVMSSTF